MGRINIRKYVLSILLLSFFAVNFFGCGKNNNNVHLKVIVIGIDGMDPKIVDSMLSKDLLPNLKKLKDDGTFSPLKTTNPAESPVAWASFITGKNPGKTKLFGFLDRDTNSYFPKYAPTKFIEGSSDHLPFYINERKGISFWKLIDDSDDDNLSAVLFCPETFPPDTIEGGVLSGMEVPDIRGTTGTFTFYTNDSTNYLSNDKIIYVNSEEKVISTFIKGPVDWTSNKKEEIKTPLFLQLDKNNSSLSITVNNKTAKLKLGEWSNWIKISFPLSSSEIISGIAKFYLESLSPLKLYLSPVNIDPENPFYKISSPNNFSKEIADRNGFYTTLGWECDTWALNEGYLDEKAFLKSAYDIFDERKKILFDLIDSRKYSMIINVFGELDRIQHMFWRYIDPKNKLYEPNAAPQFKNAIYNYYSMVDTLIGNISSMVDSSTVIILVSDHGFTSYRKGVNLNTWLVQNNFMKLEKNKNAFSSAKSFFPRVDWKKTKAYALGIGGIYLNVFGRENKGIIKKGNEYENVREEIIKKLLKLKDPETGENIIANVYKREEIYKGKYLNSAPDLVVGLIPGYRVSQISSLGGFEKSIVNDNLRKWSGDHVSVDPSFVPGVFFINRKINRNLNPAIIDVAPTILKLFKVKVPKDFDGKSLIKNYN